MNAPLDTDVAIETPEHIVFHWRVAGPARRAVAYVVDLVVCYGAIVVVGLIAAFAIGASANASELGKVGVGVLLLVLFLAQWVYFVAWEGITGRSPGKRALGLRVVTTSGRPIGMRAATLRNLLRAADALPTGYLVGVTAMAMSPRFQRLGDLVAGTMVVIPESARRAAPIELSPPAQPKELATLPDEVTLDADERAAIELFLRRRHTLGRAREHELASMVAKHIGERLGYTDSDPARLLAIVYDRAVNRGRAEAPPSSSLRPRRKRAA